MDNANLETDQFILHLTQARDMMNSSSTAESLVITGPDMSENDCKWGFRMLRPPPLMVCYTPVHDRAHFNTCVLQPISPPKPGRGSRPESQTSRGLSLVAHSQKIQPAASDPLPDLPSTSPPRTPLCAPEPHAHGVSGADQSVLNTPIDTSGIRLEVVGRIARVRIHRMLFHPQI